MSRAKTNALDALRALIAERQQYEQWISALDAKREGTPEHVFERVQADYRTRLDRVVTDIRGHAEELQLSISTLSSRLVEVAREEDTRREGLQEAELRAAVGEYEPHQWQQLKAEAEDALGKIAADRESLDNQLGELRAIQKLSEVGSVGTPPGGTPPVMEGNASPRAPAESVRTGPPAEQLISRVAPAERGTPEQAQQAASSPQQAPPSGGADQPSQTTAGHRSGTAADGRAVQEQRGGVATQRPPSQEMPRNDVPLEQVAAAASTAAGAAGRARPVRTPPGGVSTSARPKPELVRPDSAKTLKCPECGAANHPTEWYCERCGGELATM